MKTIDSSVWLPRLQKCTLLLRIVDLDQEKAPASLKDNNCQADVFVLQLIEDEWWRGCEDGSFYLCVTVEVQPTGVLCAQHGSLIAFFTLTGHPLT
jgi:hypothetical protein